MPAMHFDATLLLLLLVFVWEKTTAVAPKETVFRLAALHTEVIPGNKRQYLNITFFTKIYFHKFHIY